MGSWRSYFVNNNWCSYAAGRSTNTRYSGWQLIDNESHVRHGSPRHIKESRPKNRNLQLRFPLQSKVLILWATQLWENLQDGRDLQPRRIPTMQATRMTRQSAALHYSPISTTFPKEWKFMGHVSLTNPRKLEWAGISMRYFNVTFFPADFSETLP